MPRYIVTGTQPVLGNRMPGETFDEQIDPGVERFLLGVGAIQVVPQDAEPEPEAPAAASANIPDDVPAAEPVPETADEPVVGKQKS